MAFSYRDGYVYGQHDVLNWLERGLDGDAPLAPIDERVQSRAWAWCLAHNLSVAGFGAAMFRAGDNFGFHMGSDESQCTCQWAPNVHGEAYKGTTRCEQEMLDDPAEAWERWYADNCGDDCP